MNDHVGVAIFVIVKNPHIDADTSITATFIYYDILPIYVCNKKP